MKSINPKLPPQIVGNAGLFYVCNKLSALGWNAMPTSRNAKGIGVMCFSLGGKRTLLLQVKSLSKRNTAAQPTQRSEDGLQHGGQSAP